MNKLKIFFILLSAVAIITSTAITYAANDVSNKWNVPGDFSTIQEAIDSNLVEDGDTILVSEGHHSGAFITKSVEIRGLDGAIIDSGPMHPAGLSYGFRLMSGSDGTTISHLQFEVDLSIMNGDAVNDVTIEHNTFINSIQAISNWRGSRWVISHNEINDLRTRNGGGIGILIGDYTGGSVTENVVFQNTITGTLHVYEADSGGYDGSGIVLYADFRWGRLGTREISNNRVVKNKVSIISDTPEVVDVIAFELTDSRNDTDADPYPVIFDNAIGFNDFRGTTIQIAVTPTDLENYNDISRNMGDNRGHGLHPGFFGPGLSWSSYVTSSESNLSEEQLAKQDCVKIQDGILKSSDGELLVLGYDRFGYNYQAHMFNGLYDNYDREFGGYYPGVYLMMAWNDAWLSNTDCDGDGQLDRHYGFDSYIGSGAWTTNHMWGSYNDESGNLQTWNYFVKIIAVTNDATLTDGIWYDSTGTEIGPAIWGSFAIIQEVSNDTGTDEHGVIYLSPSGPGLGKY